MDSKWTRDHYTLPIKALENEHLLDLYTEGKEQYYLELGNVSYETLQVLLSEKRVPLINDSNGVKALSCVAIQNEGWGHFTPQSNLNEDTKALIPFLYYMNFDNNNDSMAIFLTYGLLSYRYRNQVRYAPILLIPVAIEFENAKGYLRLMGEACENKALSERLKRLNKSFTPVHKIGNTLYQFDEFISDFNNKEKDWLVHYENYLTVGKVTFHADIIDTDRFNAAHNVYSALDDECLYTPQIRPKSSFLYKPTIYSLYMGESFNSKQRRALMSALDGNTLAITGYSGSGKSTVLHAIAINALGRNKRVLYVSPFLPTLWNLEKELRKMGLDNYYEAYNPYPGDVSYQPPVKYDSKALTELYDLNAEFKNKEALLGERVHGFSYGDVLTQCALNNTSYEALPIKNITDIFSKENFVLKDGLYVLPELCQIEELMASHKVYNDSVYQVLNRKNIFKTEVYNVIKKSLQALDDNIVLLINTGQVLTDRYAFKPIDHLNHFRQIIEDWFGVDPTLYPTFWLEGGYDEAWTQFAGFLNLNTRLHEKEQEVENTYQNLETYIPSISEALAVLKGPYFSDDNGAKIDELFLHKDEIYQCTLAAEKALLSHLPIAKTALNKNKSFGNIFTLDTVELVEEECSVHPEYPNLLKTIFESQDLPSLYALFRQNGINSSTYTSFKQDVAALNKNNAPLEDYLNYFNLKGSLEQKMLLVHNYIKKPEDLTKDEIIHFKNLLKLNKEQFKAYLKQYSEYKKIYDKNKEIINYLNKKYSINYSESLLETTQAYSALMSDNKLRHVVDRVMVTALNKANDYKTIKKVLIDVCVSLDCINMAYALGLKYGLNKNQDKYQDNYQDKYQDKNLDYNSFSTKKEWVSRINNYLTPLYKEQALLESALKHHEGPVLYADFKKVEALQRDINHLKEELVAPQYQLYYGALLNIEHPSQMDIKNIEYYLDHFKLLLNYVHSLSDVNHIMTSLEDVKTLMTQAQKEAKIIITNSGIVNPFFKKEFKAQVEQSTLLETHVILEKLLTEEHLKELEGYVSISVILNKLWLKYTHLAFNNKASYEVHDLEDMIKEIALSNQSDNLAKRLNAQYFKELNKEMELSHPKLIKEINDLAPLLIKQELKTRMSENQKVINDIERTHNGLEKGLIVAPLKMLYKCRNMHFDLIIIDDAQAISPMLDDMMKDSQLVVAGDYLNYKAQWETLMSKFDAVHQYIFDYRFKLTSRAVDLGLQYYRLKNLDIERFGYVPLYADNETTYKEVILVADNYHVYNDQKELLNKTVKKIFVNRQTIKRFMKDAAEYVMKGHLLTLMMDSNNVSLLKNAYEYTLFNYFNDNEDDIKDRLTIITTQSLNQELELLKVNSTLDYRVQSRCGLRIEQVDQLTFLNNVVYDVLDNKTTYNILCESLSKEKMILETLYMLFLEKKKTLKEAINIQQRYIYFSHLSVSAIPADKTILVTSDYIGLSEKDKIANMLTQLIFNGPEIILFDGTTNRRESSFALVHNYELLGILKHMANPEKIIKEQSSDNSFFDPLSVYDNAKLKEQRWDASPLSALLKAVKECFEQLGAHVYLAQKPLDLYVIPKGSSIIYSVLIISPSFSDHLSLMNDYRDSLNHLKYVRVLKMDKAASNLAEAVSNCFKTMEEHHA